MPAFSHDLIGTMLIALVSSTALLAALWRLRDLRRTEWLRGRITNHRGLFGDRMRGPHAGQDIHILTVDGAQSISAGQA